MAIDAGKISLLKRNKPARRLLNRLIKEVPIKENEEGVPSLWYMPLVGPDSFFDGFGFAEYRKEFRWKAIPLDAHQRTYPIKNPLLPFLERLNDKLPSKWDNRTKKFVRNDD